MLKKVLCCLLSAALLALAPLPAFAQEEAAVSSNEAVTDEVGLAAPSALLMDFSTGKTLYEKNSHERRPCASITKVMTLCLVFEAIESGKLSYDDVITTSSMAAAQDGSDVWLVEGEQMTVDDLVKAVVVVSANDAAVALAEAVCGTEEAFVAKMNEKAKLLGMNDTEFKNCNGLDEEGHLTSAYDVALMSRELMKHNKIFEYTSIWLDYIRDGATQLVNTNRLLKSYDGITGLKTGTTSLAGACISATAQRGEMSLIAVVLGDKTTDERFTDASRLLDYGFGSFCSVSPEVPEDLPETIAVEGGMESEVVLRCAPDSAFLLKNGAQENVTCELHLTETAQAPVTEGQRLGSTVYKCGGETLGEFPVTAATTVERINFADVMALLFRAFVS